MKYIYLLMMGILLTNPSSAMLRIIDTAYIEVGKPMPDFKLDSIHDFSLIQASMENFKGKWLVIDFWNTNCLSCIESFPKINALQKKYKDDLQYLLIGKEEKDHSIRKIYAKFRKVLDLQIPHAFDSSLFKRFDITTCPRVVVVNPQGIVYAFTNSLDDKNIADMLAGKPTELNKVYQRNESRPQKRPISEIGDSSLLFKSVLNKWNPYIIGKSNHLMDPQNGYYETIGKDINNLYMLAYFGLDEITREDSLYGDVFPRVLFETSDKQKLEESIQKIFYCYRLTVPSAQSNKNTVMRVMQHDLNGYFGYKAVVEERMMPYWKLTASSVSREKLKTLGGPKIYQGRVDTGFIAKNVSIKEIFSQLEYIDLPLVDKTGITGNIDIALGHLLTTTDEIQKGLKENGLFLVKSRKRMKVVVIRDPVTKQTP